jgi:hypothetical protein
MIRRGLLHPGLSQSYVDRRRWKISFTWQAPFSPIVAAAANAESRRLAQMNYSAAACSLDALATSLIADVT